jgi:tetratricopeptide (TPR) repeat protein
MSAEVIRLLLALILVSTNDRVDARVDADAALARQQSSTSSQNSSPSVQSRSLPELPVLPLAQFPEPSRVALQLAFERARRAPDDELSVGQLAMTLQAWEQWEAAHAAYQRAIGLAGNGIRGDSKASKWKYLDAVVLQRLVRPNEAAVVLRHSADVHYLPAKIKLAEVLFDSGGVEESARLYEELVNEPAAEPIAELGLGRVAAAAGRYDEAVRHFARAIALFPEFGAAHYALARSARALGRTEESQRALERHQQFGARWPALDDPLLAEVAALRTDARASLQRGMKLAEAGDVPGAVAAHEAALAALAGSSAPSAASALSTPSAPSASSAAQAHVELITLYGQLSNWVKAEEHYRAAVALGVDLEAAHYNYGVLLGLQDRREEAAAAYRRALDINPLNPQARNNLGQLLERDRKYHDAAAEYRQVVEVMPTFRLARFNLGRMLIVLGRPLDAVTQLERLTEPRDVETPRYLFALATAKIHAGQRDDGVKWAHEAKRLAAEHGQHDLAAAIERDLAALSGAR